MTMTRADWERQTLRKLKSRLKREWRAPKKKHALPEVTDADYERAAEDATRRADAAEDWED